MTRRRPWKIWLLLAIVGSFLFYLFFPPAFKPRPVEFSCLDPEAGRFQALNLDPQRIYGITLSYPSIIDQLGVHYDHYTAPPVFQKQPGSLLTGNEVPMPGWQTLSELASGLDVAAAQTLQQRFEQLPTALDYEVELALVLLQDISVEQLQDPQFEPPVGYFLAGDLQSASLAVFALSQGQKRSAWLSAAKSMSGFLPVGERMWVPDSAAVQAARIKPDTPAGTQEQLEISTDACVSLRTAVNGQLRQNGNSGQRIYNHRNILRMLHAEYGAPVLKAGTAVLTGSPGGIASEVPRWRRKWWDLIGTDGMERYAWFVEQVADNPYYLQAGDEVEISAGHLGVKTFRIGSTTTAQ